MPAIPTEIKKKAWVLAASLVSLALGAITFAAISPYDPFGGDEWGPFSLPYSFDAGTLIWRCFLGYIVLTSCFIPLGLLVLPRYWRLLCKGYSKIKASLLLACMAGLICCCYASYWQYRHFYCGIECNLSITWHFFVGCALDSLLWILSWLTSLIFFSFATRRYLKAGLAARQAS